MPCRFTITEKWSDKWYRRLCPESKLLFNYICDSCDAAGFWEIDFEKASFETGLLLQSQSAGILDNCKSPLCTIEGAFEGLVRCYLREGDFVWIKKFLYHQKNLPLNPENKCHQGIIKIIKSHNSFGDKVLQEINQQLTSKGLHSPTGIGIGIGNSKGKIKGGKKHKFMPPSKEEFTAYVKTNNLNINNPESLWQGYQDGGWVDTYGNPIGNWKLKLRTLHNFAEKKNEQGKAMKKTKLFPIAGKNCHCGLPAVYKSQGGQYDSFYCADHMPEKIKEKFV